MTLKEKFFKEFGNESFRGYPLDQLNSIWDFFAKELRIQESEFNIPFSMRSPGDWTEDFQHENGNYQNKCCRCNKIFFGYKRRMICKSCATLTDNS